MKTAIKNSALPLLVFLLGCWGCTRAPLSVQIEMPQKNSIDVSQYQQFFLVDPLLDVPEKYQAQDKEIRDYLLDSLSGRLGCQVVSLPIPYWDMIRNILQQNHLNTEFQFDNNRFFQNVYLSHPKALFFAVKLKMAVKATSIVKAVRDDKGVKKNAFVPFQSWDSDMSLYLIDADKGCTVLTKAGNDKYSSDAAPAFQTLFPRIFENVVDKLLRSLQRHRTSQSRFILEE
jgi:hypothetical protein